MLNINKREDKIRELMIITIIKLIISITIIMIIIINNNDNNLMIIIAITSTIKIHIDKKLKYLQNK